MDRARQKPTGTLAMRINHNISSMITQGALFQTSRVLSKSFEKLSTGLRINSAADDAAGLGVSENLRTQIRGMEQAFRNTQDSIALLTIADGALNEQTAILQRMRELVLQAKNDTYTQTERDYMGQEFNQLVEELDRIAAATTYNGMKIFATPDASYPADPGHVYPHDYRDKTPHEIYDQSTVFGAGDEAYAALGPDDHSSSNHFNMMIGANYTAEDIAALNKPKRSYDPDAANLITVQFCQMDADGILAKDCRGWWDATEIYNGFSFHPDPIDPEFHLQDLALNLALGGSATLHDKLDIFLNLIDGNDIDPVIKNYLFAWGASNSNATGLRRINTVRGAIGAMVNRLEHSTNNLLNQIQNTQAAESLIRDADIAAESSKYTKNAILTQSALAMLAQSNISSQTAIQLIRSV
jgi:flagellin